MNEYQKFIHKSRYARYLDSEGRRETWEETVQRYCDFWEKPLPDEVKQAILDMEIMPSMRALMTAGPALTRITWLDTIVLSLPWIMSEHLMRIYMCYSVVLV